MKKIFGRISMLLEVSDEEFEELKNKYSNDAEISKKLCTRFLVHGKLTDDSYIPQAVFDDLSE